MFYVYIKDNSKWSTSVGDILYNEFNLRNSLQFTFVKCAIWIKNKIKKTK